LKTLTLAPAYGRDYSSRTAAADDWRAGKDFQIASGPDDGRYTSIRDIEAIRAEGYTHLKIRYKKLTLATIIQL
jgi:hypothetical protein